MTTVNLIGNGTLALLRNPDQLDRLRRAPAMADTAIEELLRYDSPLELSPVCFAATDLELGGTMIPKGAPVRVLISSANRDERVFSDPDTLTLRVPRARIVVRARHPSLPRRAAGPARRQDRAASIARTRAQCPAQRSAAGRLAAAPDFGGSATFRCEFPRSVPRSVTAAIASGLAALSAACKGPDALSRCGPARADGRERGSLFSTAYVMMGAGRLLPANQITRSVTFIRSQRRSDGFLEFDPATPVPPDSADIRLLPGGAGAAWRRGRTRYWGGIAAGFLARAQRAVPYLERARGMWSLPECDDPVVNCNILFALRLLGSPATETETMATRDLIARTVQESSLLCVSCHHGP